MKWLSTLCANDADLERFFLINEINYKKKKRVCPLMIVIFTDYFFLDFVIPGVKYNIYGLGCFADNQIALLFYPIVVEI